MFSRPGGRTRRLPLRPLSRKGRGVALCLQALPAPARGTMRSRRRSMGGGVRDPNPSPRRRGPRTQGGGSVIRRRNRRSPVRPVRGVRLDPGDTPVDAPCPPLPPARFAPSPSAVHDLDQGGPAKGVADSRASRRPLRPPVLPGGAFHLPAFSAASRYSMRSAAARGRRQGQRFFVPGRPPALSSKTCWISCRTPLCGPAGAAPRAMAQSCAREHKVNDR